MEAVVVDVEVVGVIMEDGGDYGGCRVIVGDAFWVKFNLRGLEGEKGKSFSSFTFFPISPFPFSPFLLSPFPFFPISPFLLFSFQTPQIEPNPKRIPHNHRHPP